MVMDKNKNSTQQNSSAARQRRRGVIANKKQCSKIPNPSSSSSISGMDSTLKDVADFSDISTTKLNQLNQTTRNYFHNLGNTSNACHLNIPKSAPNLNIPKSAPNRQFIFQSTGKNINKNFNDIVRLIAANESTPQVGSKRQPYYWNTVDDNLNPDVIYTPPTNTVNFHSTKSSNIATTPLHTQVLNSKSSTPTANVPFADITKRSQNKVSNCSTNIMRPHNNTNQPAFTNFGNDIPHRQFVFKSTGTNLMKNFNDTENIKGSDSLHSQLGCKRKSQEQKFGNENVAVNNLPTNSLETLSLFSKKAKTSHLNSSTISTSASSQQCQTNDFAPNAQTTQPYDFSNIVEPPMKKSRYETRGVNLYNKFTATVTNQTNDVAIDAVGDKTKSQYSTLFEDHVMETSSDESEADNNSSTDADEETDDQEDLTDDEHQGYFDIGDPVWECQQCGAHMWYQERKNRSKNTLRPEFQQCCHG
ncbi:helicase-like protein, partial [Trifolium pratense]